MNGKTSVGRGKEENGNGCERMWYTQIFYSMNISQISRAKFLFNSALQEEMARKRKTRFDKLSKRAFNVEAD